MLRLLRSIIRMNFLSVKLWRKENKFMVVFFFLVTPQTAQVMATVHGKCLVRMKKSLNLWVGEMNRKRVPIYVGPKSTEPVC